jgi:3'-phosphoadenosine 5'-phosphosulfate sulfotransferase (PAPS reductase)/FAD synthetase
MKGKGEYKLYLGIAADEPKRVKEFEYPLVDWGITEKQALEYCYSKGFDWGGLYKDFRRVSCYLCPLQRIGDWRTLRKKYPDLYADALELDKHSCYQFKPNYSLHDLDRRFAQEDMQQNLF